MRTPRENLIAVSRHGATPPELDELRATGTRRTFKPGRLLLLEGSDPGPVMIVESGLVKIFVTAEDGGELLLGLRGEGELLGEMSSLEQRPRSASAAAHTSVVVTEVSGAAFRGFLRRNPETTLRMLMVSQQRLRQAERERLAYLSKRVTARVAARLLDWSVHFGCRLPDGSIEVRQFSRRELAQSIAASEKTVDDALAELTRARLIGTGRLRFVVLDPMRLSERARGIGQIS